MKTIAQKDCDRAAEWIPPWTGGLRFVTLWDMKEYQADRLVEISRCLTQLGFIGLKNDEEFDKERDHVAHYLRKIEYELGFLSLDVTGISVNRAQSKVKTASADQLLDVLEEIEGRFNDEIDAITFLYLAPEKRQYFSKTDLFGQEFKNKFPTGNAEIIEAGNCFALGRFTACVYHLTRAMEIALRVLFVALGMPPRVWSTTKWNNILDRIKGKIDKNNKTLANDHTWQSERGFYENAHAFLAAVRVPIRNSTMHVESVYDETGAENVFGAVKTFMRNMATKLKEIP